MSEIYDIIMFGLIVEWTFMWANISLLFVIYLVFHHKKKLNLFAWHNDTTCIKDFGFCIIACDFITDGIFVILNYVSCEMIAHGSPLFQFTCASSLVLLFASMADLHFLLKENIVRPYLHNVYHP